MPRTPLPNHRARSLECPAAPKRTQAVPRPNEINSNVMRRLDFTTNI